MKKVFTANWIKSVQPRKQRKYRYNAPLHLKSKFLNVHLDKTLKSKYGIRSIRVRKGDTVKISKGNYRGKSGKVDKVSLKYLKIYVQGIEQMKKDGSKSLVAIEPTNTIITNLDLSDKKRSKKLKVKND
jgi:large subunit ribosomal protein L24